MFRSLLALLLILPLSFFVKAGAYEFAPIVAQFEASGSGSARNFTARNTQSEPVALQIEVFARTADEFGNEIRTPDYDNFIITPPQLVLAPGASRSIRAQWIGEAAPEHELAYRIVVSQLPISFQQGDEQTGVNASVAVGYRYEVAAYVTPQNAKPEASLVRSEAVTNADGAQFLRVTIQNSGTQRAILNHPKLTVTSASDGGRTVLEGEAVSALHMKNILSKSQSAIDLPWPEGVPFGEVSANFETGYFTIG